MNRILKLIESNDPLEFDNMFYPLSREEQAFLDALASYVNEFSPLGYGDSGVLCRTKAMSPIFRKLRLPRPKVTHLFHTLAKMGYIVTDIIPGTVTKRGFIITNKGWIASTDWNPEDLVEIAQTEVEDTWDWENVLPTVPKNVRRAIESSLKIHRS
jgi:hypothetical protein